MSQVASGKISQDHSRAPTSVLEGFLELVTNFRVGSKKLTMKYHNSKLINDGENHERTY